MTSTTYPERDVEKIAWTVLIGSFVMFMVLLVGVPLGVYWYLNTATDAVESDLTVLSGTVIVEMQGRDPTGEQKARMVSEGSTIRTDSNTRVNLMLVDGSSVIVFPDTQVTLGTMRSPKFSISPRPWQVYLNLRSGRLRLDVSPSDSRPLEMKVQTPQGEAQLQVGNYNIEVVNDQTDVIVRDGEALVNTRTASLSLSARERGLLRDGESPRGPLTAERDLIANGTFSSVLSDDIWRVYNDQGGDGPSVDGTAQAEIDQGRHVLHFVRKDSKGNHDDTGIEQIIDKDVTDVDVVRFRADVRVNYQSLSGGGYQSSEFPLMIRIHYRDVKGGERDWVHGFYYQNIEGKNIVRGDQIPQGLWFPYESENFLTALDPKPARILSIQIFGSGHDFDSMVADVGLTVE
jgi:FecR-like protein